MQSGRPWTVRTGAPGHTTMKPCHLIRDRPFPPTVLLEISRLLNTGLDMESLSICVRLCEQGINPEALSAVIKELRKASESLKVHRPPRELLRGRARSSMHIQHEDTAPANVYFLSPLGGCSWQLNVEYHEMIQRGVWLTGTVYCEGPNIMGCDFMSSPLGF